MRSSILFFAAMALSTAACDHERGSETTPTAASNDAAGRADARLIEATGVLADVTASEQIPGFVKRDAQCVAVVPDLLQGGLLIGGKHGRGVVTCKVGAAWSQPAFFEISGGTAGAQIGAQSADVVMVVVGDRGRQAFFDRDFRVGADLGATAGPTSASRGSDTTSASLRSEIVTYSHSRGLFAGVELGGAKIKQDPQASAGFYGRDVGFTELLGTAATPAPHVDELLTQVRKSF